MKNAFHDSRMRIKWARQFTNQLGKRIRAFFKTRPYGRAVEMDAEGVYELHKVKLTKPLPELFTTKTVKALEDLRSALDLAATAVAKLAKTPDGDVYFPFCATVGDMDGRIKRACNQLPAEIKALFASFRPYSGGDDLLWALNQLCRASKHRMIVPVGVATPGMTISKAVIHGPGYIPCPRWNREKDEMVFAAVKPSSNPYYNVRVSFHIVFGDVEVVKGRAVMGVLKDLIEKVDGIVKTTESECKKLGLLQ